MIIGWDAGLSSATISRVRRRPPSANVPPIVSRNVVARESEWTDSNCHRSVIAIGRSSPPHRSCIVLPAPGGVCISLVMRSKKSAKRACKDTSIALATTRSCVGDLRPYDELPRPG